MKADLSRCYETRKSFTEYKQWREGYIRKLRYQVGGMGDHEIELLLLIYKDDSEVMKILNKESNIRKDNIGKYSEYYFY